MTATPAPALSDAEQQTVDRFGIFEPEEREAALVETVARALVGMPVRVNVNRPGQVPSWWTGELQWDDRTQIAAAAITAYRAAQDGGAEEAVRRVEALLDPEAGMATGNGYDSIRLFSEKDIRAALATQAGDAR